MEDSTKKNFFAQFLGSDKNMKQLSAAEFAEVWNHFDKDGNGYIEGNELQEFLSQFLSTKKTDDPNQIGESEMKTKLKEFMDKYDDNKDNRIEMCELANILPEDENFLLLFRRSNAVKSSKEFMEIWKKFDKDHNGYIDSSELSNFLKDLLKDVLPEGDPRLKDYSHTILQLFDYNKDGKLQLSEMAKLLPNRENHLSKPFMKNADKISPQEIDKIFDHYDADGNGTIENDELDGFMKDVLDLLKETYSMEDIQSYRNIILGEWDVDHDGKISRDEMKMILLQHQKLSCKK